MPGADSDQTAGYRKVPVRHPFDAMAQTWMVATARRVPRADVPWLIGPAAGSDVVGHGWVEREAAAIGGRTSRGPEHGLLPSFAALAGSRFDPADVDPRIADFYERTSAWRLDVSFGMDSEVVHLHDAVGEVVGAAWQRTMRKAGATVYSGLYGTTSLPGSSQPSVRVVFPLPGGSLPVFLAPSADDRGRKLCTSGGSRSPSTFTSMSTRTAMCAPITHCGCGTSPLFGSITGCVRSSPQ